MNKIALISTPWPLFKRPSIQLGALKAFLQDRLPDLQVNAFHLYLHLAQAIGYRVYHDISERTWLAESMYAALLFPDRTARAEALFRKESAAKKNLRRLRFKTLASRIKKATDAFLKQHHWKTYGLLGFSISLCQLTSALYVIKWLKKRFPELIIVVGGASTSGIAGRGLLEHFAEIDMVVNGEGEWPLYQIIQHLRKNPNDWAAVNASGVITRFVAPDQAGSLSVSQLKELKDLPAPDYDDYFRLLESFDPANTFFPTLPVEISRGCWWKKATGLAKTTGCAFCNLNLQWDGYRTKSASQVVSEIDHLTGRHQSLSVALTDNVLPKKGSIEIFKRIESLHKDLRIFGEVRATTPRKELKVLRDAGMHQVQIGIEALSSSLLKKLHKGTSAIQNLEIMKNCEALGIESISNLILQFPGSNEQDVAETLKALEFARPFHPLKAVNFWLGLESPVWQQPKVYGIKALFNHPNWSYLFPPAIYRSLPLMIQAYRGDLTYQRKIWKPVRKEISEWQQQYATVKKTAGDEPILSLRDGKDFIIIRQQRYQADPAVHRLVGPSRKIYLYCQRHRQINSICREFSSISEETIAKFLKMMVDKKLMFAEKNRYLSLAAPIRAKSA
ncbi:MAG: RiPP maturation radical SAM C-methyltransferase [Desulfobacterales bacterium]|nr:RiPP maturation radical SAM C-methyltransferase [Desulfobacterales bacterium]